MLSASARHYVSIDPIVRAGTPLLLLSDGIEFLVDDVGDVGLTCKSNAKGYVSN